MKQAVTSNDPHALVPLALLKTGESSVVAHVETDGPLGERLLHLGFIPGTRVEVVRRAPLGDPLCYSVLGANLCLRQSEARRIWVRPPA